MTRGTLVSPIDRFEEAEDGWQHAPARSANSAGPQDPTGAVN